MSLEKEHAKKLGRVAVRLGQAYGVNSRGDICGFPKEEAAMLVSKRLAAYHDPDKAQGEEVLADDHEEKVGEEVAASKAAIKDGRLVNRNKK